MYMFKYKYIYIYIYVSFTYRVPNVIHMSKLIFIYCRYVYV